MGPRPIARIAVVGGGMLGCALALRLARGGVGVVLYEADDQLGGLSVPSHLGDFTWDRFYHCILPSDRVLVSLLDEIGLGADLVRRPTRAGVFIEGEVHPLDGALDLLRLPRLSMWSKLRVGALAALAPRRAATAELDSTTAADWLRRWCGGPGFDGFWRHLLRSKLGGAADRVSARFIHATISRLASARSGTGGGEELGYVRGGYRRILQALRDRLVAEGVEIRTGHQVSRVAPSGEGVVVEAQGRTERHLGVALTVPNPVVARVVEGLRPDERSRLAGTPYLGIVCTVVVGAAPLSGRYVLNLCDDGFSITGVVEMTGLVSAAEETGGHALVYLPRYALADDGVFARSDAELQATALADLGRIFPMTREGWVRHVEVHRARLIQPVPLAGAPPFAPSRRPLHDAKVFVVNSAQIPSCVLNNNDCVALAADGAAEILRALEPHPRTMERVS